METCRKLEEQTLLRACSRARAKTGKRMAARMAMIAITTRSSISVKPVLREPLRAIGSPLSSTLKERTSLARGGRHSPKARRWPVGEVLSVRLSAKPHHQEDDPDHDHHNQTG